MKKKLLVAFQIELNKLLTKICKICKKNGSVFPGSITYNINQKILERITYPKYVIAVTGSSGKGTTTALIAHILKSSGHDVIYNESGSNGIRAITTLILNHCNIFGKFQHEILLLEVDEKHLHLAFQKNKMTHLVLTNITRDQTARNGSSDLVYESIKKCIEKDTTIILNADDPCLMKTKDSYPEKCITYGLDKTPYSYRAPKNTNIDYAYCPKCHKKLIYHYYHYGHIGSYTCPNGDFQRGKIDFEGKRINLKQGTMQIRQSKIILHPQMLYVAYAATAAYALCHTLKIPEKQIEKALQNPPKINRANRYKLENRTITMLESKNENPISYEQSIQYIQNQEGAKTIIIGFDNVSRRYQYNDLSWLWDIEFELLQKAAIDKILCVGRFQYNIATRLFYAGIPKESIIFIKEINQLIPVIKKETIGNIYTIMCFDMTEKIKTILEENQNANH